MAGENVAKLVVQIDATQARAAQAQLERDFGATVGRMDERSKAIDRSVATWGTSMQRTAQLGQRAMQAMSAGIGAATAATAASERQWLSLGTSILASFAAGGPVAGGIAIISAGIGVLGQSAGKAAEDAMRRADAARQRYKELEKTIEDFETYADAAKKLNVQADALTRIRDITREIGEAEGEIAEKSARRAELRLSGTHDKSWGSRGDELRALNEQIEALKQNLPALARLRDLFEKDLRVQSAFGALAREEELQALRDRNDRLRSGLGGGFNRSNEMEIQDGIDALERQREALVRVHGEKGDRAEFTRLNELIKLAREHLGIQTKLNDLAVSRIDRGLAREVELLQARNDQERELIRLRHRSQDLLESGASPVAVSALEAATRAAAARRPWDDLLRSADQTLGQGLSDLIYDGIVNGFENASDIAETIWQTLLRQLINQFVTSGIQGLFSGLGGGGGGGLLGVFGSFLGGGGGGGGGGGVLGSVAAPAGPSLPDILGGGCAGGT